MSEDLLNTLEDLGDEEFSKFKWFLQQANILQGLPTIKKSRLEAANRWDSVDLMVQTYRLSGAVSLTRKVLETINRNDLLQSLSARGSRGGQSQQEKDDVSAVSLSFILVISVCQWMSGMERIWRIEDLLPLRFTPFFLRMKVS